MNLRDIQNFYLNIFASRKIFLVLIFSWFVIIVFTYFILPPAADDMFYFWPALSFFYENKIGMYEGEKFVTTFFQFPTYSLINGFFLNFYDFFGIQITSYSYKFFNKFLLILMFVLSIYWIKKTSNKNSFFLKINTFLILITFTPFSLGVIGSVRPEVLGIVFVLISIILFNEISKTEYKSSYRIIFSSFFLGLAFTVHPQFFTITSILALVMLYELYLKPKNFKLIFVFCFFFIIPIIFLFIWYYLKYPDSVDFLINRANYIGSSPVEILRTNFVNLTIQALLLSEAPIFTKIYQSIFTLPYLILLVIIFPILFLYKKKINFSFDQKITISILFSILFNFSFIKTYDFYHGVIAFFTLLAFSSVLSFQRDDFIKDDKKFNKFFITIFCLMIFVINSFFVVIHGSKYLFSQTKYFYMPQTKNKVLPYIEEDTKFILTSEKLFGVFIEFFEKRYLTNMPNNIYMLFPFPDAGPTKNQFLNAKSFLNTKLSRFNKFNVIFGSKLSTSLIDREKKYIILNLNGNLKILIDYDQILFEDKENIFFSSKNIKIDK